MGDTIYTVGHSTHPQERFIGLLLKAGVTAISDVRSKPYKHAHMGNGGQQARTRCGVACRGKRPNGLPALDPCLRQYWRAYRFGKAESLRVVPR
jgi:hypothetical protein